MLEFGKQSVFADLKAPCQSMFIEEKTQFPNFERIMTVMNNGILTGIKQIKKDRIVFFILRKKSLKYAVVLELTGKFAFVYFIDEQGKILKILKNTKAVNRRNLTAGSIYKPPDSRNNEINFPHLKILGITPVEFECKYPNAQHYVLFDGHNILLPDVQCKTQCTKFDSLSEGIRALYAVCVKKNAKIREKEPNYSIKDQLARTAEYDFYRRLALYLKTHTEDIQDGVVEFEGKRIVLPSKIRGQKIIDFYFKKSKRMKRGHEKLTELLQHSVVKQVAPKPVQKKTSSKPWRETLSPSGFKVMVGKNSRSNNIITFNMASGEDYFFHVQDAPGCHVIMKTGKKVPQDKDVAFCARLAVLCSKAKRNLYSSVSYTRVKYVRPVKGIPGKVLLTKFKTIRVKID